MLHPRQGLPGHISGAAEGSSPCFASFVKPGVRGIGAEHEQERKTGGGEGQRQSGQVQQRHPMRQRMRHDGLVVAGGDGRDGGQGQHRRPNRIHHPRGMDRQQMPRVPGTTAVPRPVLVFVHRSSEFHCFLSLFIGSFGVEVASVIQETGIVEIFGMLWQCPRYLAQMQSSPRLLRAKRCTSLKVGPER